LTFIVDKGKDIANQIIQAGGKAIVVSGDVTDLTFPERLIEETVKYEPCLCYLGPMLFYCNKSKLLWLYPNQPTSNWIDQQK
jgi:hypothetical protein